MRNKTLALRLARRTRLQTRSVRAKCMRPIHITPEVIRAVRHHLTNAALENAVAAPTSLASATTSSDTDT